MVCNEMKRLRHNVNLSNIFPLCDLLRYSMTGCVCDDTLWLLGGVSLRAAPDLMQVDLQHKTWIGYTVKVIQICVQCSLSLSFLARTRNFLTLLA